MRAKYHFLSYILLALSVLAPSAIATAQTTHSQAKCCGTTEVSPLAPHSSELRSATTTEARAIVNDRVLRTYRLAIVVDYSYLMNNFAGDVSRAEDFCKRVGQELDRIYRRDVGIRLQLVLRPELIRRTEAQAVFGYTSGKQSLYDAPYIVERSTAQLNNLIGADSYDLGLWLVNFWGYNGKAVMNGGFAQTNKAAAAVSNMNIGTIAHELAHLFGAQHTASQNVDYSMHTEPEDGTSIMSYGFHATEPSKLFFSLPSIQQIRSNLSRCGYYRNGDKQQLVPSKYEDYTNLPSAVELASMRPESFSLSTVAKTYTLPKGTSIRLGFPAYSDAKDYLYNAHQNDQTRAIRDSRAKLEAGFWQESPVVFLGLPQYNTYQDYTDYQVEQKIGLPVGEYKILAGAVERTVATGSIDHKQGLDAVEAQLRVVEGKPLRLTTNSTTRYLRAGQQLSLRWEAEPSLFAEYKKVRIWLSDDYGKSYKYLLVDETDNDGEHTLTVPAVSIGAERALGGQEQGKAVFLLEIVGHIACATTDYRPLRHTTGGGFVIQSSETKLQPYTYPYLERGGSTTPTPPSVQYYRVTLQQSSGGRLSIEHSDLSRVAAGTTLRVKATVDEGYELVGLQAGTQDILSSREFVVQGDTEVRATYRRVAPTTYRVTLVQSDGGTLSIAHENLSAVVSGTKLRVDVSVADGYELVGLQAGTQDILSSREFAVQGDTEVRATYRRKAPTTYRVTLIQSDGGTLSIAHENLSAVVSGAKLRVDVSVADGYELVGLQAGTQDILSSREFVVQGDTEVRATYRKLEVPIVSPPLPHEDEESRPDEEIKVYPTVFASELHVSGYKSLSNIEIYSLSGQRLRRYTPSATLSVEGLPAGIYLVLLHPAKGGGRSQRFTVQKR
ncbi:MAG: zinc-dependent metalloprotease [Porphyromonas sp.]|nr:zinc-dependent metalloprotease [Porphyromonas sp.]